MSHQKFVTAAIGAALAGAVAFAVIPPAFADGMEKPPAPATPLDKAIDQIQNKEPPVPVAPPAPEPVIEQTPPPPAPLSRVVEVQPNTSFFGLSIGAYDLTHGKNAAALTVTYQPGVKILGILQPLFGGFVTTNGAVMGYGGVGAPIHLGKHIFVMPSFAVGAYGHGGGYDIGQVLAYRTGAEIAYEFDNKSRLGLDVAEIGSSLKRRDRTDIISLVYTMPFNLFSGHTGKPDLVAAPAPAPAEAPAVEIQPSGRPGTPDKQTPPPDAPAADQAIDRDLRK